LRASVVNNAVQLGEGGGWVTAAVTDRLGDVADHKHIYTHIARRVIGLSSALDTLCGQAYGARSYKLLGVYLQRAQLICWTLCIPIAALWLNVG